MNVAPASSQPPLSLLAFWFVAEHQFNPFAAVAIAKDFYLIGGEVLIAARAAVFGLHLLDQLAVGKIAGVDSHGTSDY